MKKVLCVLAYLLLPSIFINPFIYSILPTPTDLFCIATYIITVLGLALFFKYHPCNFFVVLLGLLLSGLITLISEAAMHSPPYLFTFAFILMYTLPCSILFSIVFLIVHVRTKLRK